MHDNAIHVLCNIQRSQSTRETACDEARKRYAHASALELWSIKQRRIKRFRIIENINIARSRVRTHADERQTFNQNETGTQGNTIHVSCKIYDFSYLMISNVAHPGCQNIRNNYG